MSGGDREQAQAQVAEGTHAVAPGSDVHRQAVEQLLWTPTEGQDLTKSYFPLSENSDDTPN